MHDHSSIWLRLHAKPHREVAPWSEHLRGPLHRPRPPTIGRFEDPSERRGGGANFPLPRSGGAGAGSSRDPLIPPYPCRASNCDLKCLSCGLRNNCGTSHTWQVGSGLWVTRGSIGGPAPPPLESEAWRARVSCDSLCDFFPTTHSGAHMTSLDCALTALGGGGPWGCRVFGDWGARRFRLGQTGELLEGSEAVTVRPKWPAVDLKGEG